MTLGDSGAWVRCGQAKNHDIQHQDNDKTLYTPNIYGLEFVYSPCSHVVLQQLTASQQDLESKKADIISFPVSQAKTWTSSGCHISPSHPYIPLIGQNIQPICRALPGCTTYVVFNLSQDLAPASQQGFLLTSSSVLHT